MGSRKQTSTVAVRVFSPQVAYLMTNLMESVVDSGTGAGLRSYGIQGAVAGKTGTSDDGWFAGYTPGIVCVVWVGFDDKRDLRLKASESALPIWADFMKQALDIRPELSGKAFSRPGGITTARIDPETGLLASPDCPQTRDEIFLAGTEPYNTCSHEPYLDESLTAEMELYPTSEYETEEWGYGTITVAVCKETGYLTSSSCPAVERSFEIGKEPRDFCRPEFHLNQRKEKNKDERDEEDEDDGRGEDYSRANSKSDSEKKFLRGIAKKWN
jgi:penicillin-binding protein 1B